MGRYTQPVLPALCAVLLLGNACSHSIPQSTSKPVPPSDHQRGSFLRSDGERGVTGSALADALPG
jgi:hypothetical protein